jgi:hypothetical protein
MVARKKPVAKAVAEDSGLCESIQALAATHKAKAACSRTAT